MSRYPLWISLVFTWLYISSLYSTFVAEIYLFLSFLLYKLEPLTDQEG
jgi:hypothetical protein